MMKKAVITIITLILLLAVSCSEYNIYREDIAICRVGDTYFDTIQAAVDYIGSSRSVSEERTVYLLKDVLKGEYDDSIRKGVTVPASFTGDLRIDFSGHRYDFSSKEQYFFRFLGGSTIEVVNGTSVIYADSISTESALIVGTRTVTIDEHLIRDLRNSKKAAEVNGEGKLVLKNSELIGDWAFDSGTETEIRKGTYTFDSITGDGSLKIYEATIVVNHDTDDRVNDAINSVPEEERGKVDKSLVHELVYHPAVPSTCTTAGTKAYWECVAEGCGKLFLDKEGTQETTLAEITVSPIGHTLTEVAEKDSTCTVRGNIRYWVCSVCDKYFSDEAGTAEITDKNSVYKDLLDHIMVYDHNEYSHWRYCSLNCGTVEPAVSHDFSTWTIQGTGEAVRQCKTEGCGFVQNTKDGEWTLQNEVPATCGTDGRKAHYTVKGAGYTLLFNEGKTAFVTEEDLTIPKTGNHTISDKWSIDELNGTHYHACTVCGNRFDEEVHTYEVMSDADGHWNQCSKCGYAGEKSDHTFGTWHVVDGRPGYAVKTCTYEDCGYYVSNESGVWSELIYRAPTCDYGKRAHYECRVDDEVLLFSEDRKVLYSESDIILEPTGEHDPDLEHWYAGSDLSDGKHYRKCKVCGTIIESLSEEHTMHFGWNEHVHFSACEKCEFTSFIQFHTYGAWTVVDESSVRGTCTYGGCEHTKVFEGEWSDLITGTPATCVNDGVYDHYDFTFSNGTGTLHFNTSKTEVLTDLTIPATGIHTPSEKWYVDTENGKHYHICTVCDERVDEADHSYTVMSNASGHWNQCSVCGHAEAVSAHVYGSWSVKGTDSIVRRCTVNGCGYTQEYSGTWSDYFCEIPATCDTDGTLGHYDFTYRNESGGSVTVHFNSDKSAELTDLTISRTGHSLQYHAATVAAETAHGNEEYWYCSACEIYFRNALCTERFENADAVIRHYSVVLTNSTSHWHVCSVCGIELSEAAVHTPVLAHDGSKHWMECSYCGYITRNPADHTFGAWTLNSQRTAASRACSVCNYSETLTGTLTHVDNSATCTEAGNAEHYEFTTSGQVLYFSTSYVYLPDGPASSPALGHDFDMNTWGGSDGTYHYHVCNRCDAWDYSTKQTHAYGPWIVDREPTATVPGIHHRNCTVCGHTDSETYSKGTLDITVDSTTVSLRGMSFSLDRVSGTENQYRATVTVPSGLASPSFRWQLDNAVQAGTQSTFTFTCTSQGEHKVSMEILSGTTYGYAEAIFTIRAF